MESHGFGYEEENCICKTRPVDFVFYVQWVVGSIRVKCSWSDSIKLMLGGSLCIVECLDIERIRCWVFQSTPFAKTVDCVLFICVVFASVLCTSQFLCWARLESCHMHLAVPLSPSLALRAFPSLSFSSSSFPFPLFLSFPHFFSSFSRLQHGIGTRKPLAPLCSAHCAMCTLR